MPLRIAQVKVVPEKGALAANHRRLMGLLDRVAADYPDVVVTPEGFLDGYVSTEDTVTAATIAEYAIDPADSPYVRDVAHWAAARQSWVVFGCARRTSAGIYNSALILNREGVLAGVYDKTHLQTHDLKYAPGAALPVFSSDFGTFGVMICADRRWPETVRTLALRGARVIFNPTYGMHDERNLCMMRTRSFESEVFIAFTHPQQALVTGPRGEVLTNVEDPAREYVVTVIDPDEADRVRARASAHLKDRRPEIYAR